MKDYLKMTALEIGAEIKKGSVSSVEVTKAVIEQIKSVDTNINAVISLFEEQALQEAEAIQDKIKKGELLSPLAGVPIIIKDNICTKGQKTTCASNILGNFEPPYDATVIARIKKAGMIIVGKANMDEFAMGSTTETSAYGAAKNPHDVTRVPGGSSGGSAAAVAAGEIHCALGSDTGGSIRQPASYCGVTGFKPTYGTVSRFGLIAYASSLDQIGPLAKDVSDCAALMDIIKGEDEFDGTSLKISKESYLSQLNGNISGLKVALPYECFDEGLDAEVKNHVLAMVKVLESQGAVISKINLPFIRYAVPAYYIMATAEASSNLSRFDGVKYGFRAENYDGLSDLYEATRSEGFGDEVKKRILLGTFVLSSGYYDAYYRKALQVKSLIKEQFDQVFKEYDIVICPTVPTTAPVLGESLTDPLKMYLTDIFTVSVNIAGLPGLSVPCGYDAQGLPVGAQIIGPRLGDVNVLNAGYSYQSVTNYHKAKTEVK